MILPGTKCGGIWATGLKKSLDAYGWKGNFLSPLRSGGHVFQTLVVSHVFLKQFFTRKIGGSNHPIWRAYFSDGLVKNHHLVFWEWRSRNLRPIQSLFQRLENLSLTPIFHTHPSWKSLLVNKPTRSDPSCWKRCLICRLSIQANKTWAYLRFVGHSLNAPLSWSWDFTCGPH